MKTDTAKSPVALFIEKRIKEDAFNALSTRQKDILDKAERDILERIAFSEYDLTDIDDIDCFCEESDIEDELLKINQCDPTLRHLIYEYISTVDDFK